MVVKDFEKRIGAGEKVQVKSSHGLIIWNSLTESQRYRRNTTKKNYETVKAKSWVQWCALQRVHKIFKILSPIFFGWFFVSKIPGNSLGSFYMVYSVTSHFTFEWFISCCWTTGGASLFPSYSCLHFLSFL